MSRLVLLHGWLGRGADWDAVGARLPPATVVLAPDLPGHGRALGLPARAYTMDGAASRVAAAMRDRWGDAPAAVAGYSMGGRLALHLARRHPGCVAALVLVSASPGLRTEAERSARRALDATRAAALQADPAAFLDAWYRMPLFTGLDDAARAALVADRLTTVDPAEAATALVGMGTGAQPSHWSALARIHGPVWAVAGARDAKFVALAHAMAAAGPVTPVLVPHAGHALPTESPSAVASTLHAALAHV